MSRWDRIGVSFVVSLSVMGCGQKLPRYPFAPSAIIVTEGVTITSTTGLRLTPSEEMAVSEGRAVGCATDWDATSWQVMHQNATKWGVRELAVQLQVPQLQQPLYGYLALCGIPPNASGPGARRYRIEVPHEYVEATSDGRYSVVMETFSASRPDGSSGEFAPWVLWLAREPFPGIHR